MSEGQTSLGAFTYDGLGRRVSRSVGGTTTKPAYDGWNLVQERDGSGAVAAEYLTGLGLDQPFLRTAGLSTSYYLSDALGSIVGLADPTGAVMTSYTYEPYGKTTVSGTASASFLGFTGRDNDSTGTLSLYNYRARAYAPTLQRFLSEDPIGISGGDVNFYAYVGNAPLTTTDPLGLEPGGDCGGLIGCLSPGIWQWLTLGSALACAFGLPCVFVTGLIFFVKEIALLDEFGLGEQFLLHSVFNVGTTVIPAGIGALLSRSLAAGASVTLVSRFDGRLFWGSLPSAVCASSSWCASPSWDWPPTYP